MVLTVIFCPHSGLTSPQADPVFTALPAHNSNEVVRESFVHLANVHSVRTMHVAGTVLSQGYNGPSTWSLLSYAWEQSELRSVEQQLVLRASREEGRRATEPSQRKEPKGLLPPGVFVKWSLYNNNLR